MFRGAESGLNVARGGWGMSRGRWCPGLGQDGVRPAQARRMPPLIRSLETQHAKAQICVSLAQTSISSAFHLSLTTARLGPEGFWGQLRDPCEPPKKNLSKETTSLFAPPTSSKLRY